MQLSENVSELDDKNRLRKTHLFPVRYSSFNINFSQGCTLPACTLAKYGFYYDGAAKLIRCFECNFEHGDLQQGLLTTILHKHYKHSMDCKQVIQSLEYFLNDNKTERIDEVPLCNQIKSDITYCYKSMATRLQSFENIRMKLNHGQLAKNGLYRVLLKETLLNPNIKTQMDTLSVHVPSLIHLKCAFCSYECLVPKNKMLNTNYKNPIEEHTENYSNTCTILTDPSQPKGSEWLRILFELDKNSFKDSSECFWSKNSNEIDDLVVTKIPTAIDQLITRETNQYKNLIYVPKKTNSTQFESLMATSDFNKLQTVLNMSETVINEKAYHPSFKMHHTRLETFKDWPKGLTQQPNDLARAGFYYFGIKDMVKCFFCNGGLKDWKQNDDPYQDHVRWFPRCQFIRQLMGPEYIEQIREKFANQDSGFNDDHTNPAINHTETNNLKTNRKRQSIESTVSPCLLNSYLDTNIIRDIVANKIVSKDAIKDAIETSLLSKDLSKNSPLDIAKIALDIRYKKEKKEERLAEISDLLICNLTPAVGVEDIRSAVSFQFGISPSRVRILREYGTLETRCIALVSLEHRDHHLINKILTEFNQKSFKLNKTEGDLQVFKTNWVEFEEIIESFSDKNSIVQSIHLKEDNILVNEKLASLSMTLPSAEDSKKTNKLKEENERLKSERLCSVCLTKDKNVLFLPCAHLAACLDCSFNMQSCPLCRTKIKATVRTYS